MKKRLKRVFCFSCKSCEWLQVYPDVSRLADATKDNGEYCPKCGQKAITYVEFEDQLWRFDSKNGDWILAKDQGILKSLRQMCAL